MKAKTFVKILDLIADWTLEKIDGIKNQKNFDPEMEKPEFDQYVDLLLAPDFLDEEIKEQIKEYRESKE